jgi:hypothetical protein
MVTYQTIFFEYFENQWVGPYIFIYLLLLLLLVFFLIFFSFLYEFCDIAKVVIIHWKI